MYWLMTWFAHARKCFLFVIIQICLVLWAS